MNERKSSAQLKSLAKGQLLGNYKTAALALLVMQLIIRSVLIFAETLYNLNDFAAQILYLLIAIIISLLTAVFLVGQYRIYLNLIRNHECSFQDMWHGFSFYPDKAIRINLSILMKSAAWALPFGISLYMLVATRNYLYFIPTGFTFVIAVVAGFYISLTYSQALFLLLDYPDESHKELLAHSAELMKQNKFRLFYISVSFIGLYVLGILSFGIGLFWVMPYMYMVKANFYEDLIR